jgi:hypothetical protein
MKLCCAVVVLGIDEALAMKRLPVFSPLALSLS